MELEIWLALRDFFLEVPIFNMRLHRVLLPRTARRSCAVLECASDGNNAGTFSKYFTVPRQSITELRWIVNSMQEVCEALNLRPPHTHQINTPSDDKGCHPTEQTIIDYMFASRTFVSP
eukprot:6462188-Amphidinium_carterae.1